MKETKSLEIATNAGVYKVSGGSPTVELPERDVAWLARRKRETWAVVDEEEIWRRGPDATWQRVASSAGLTIRTLLPIADGLLVGSDEAHLFRYWHGPDLEPLMSFEFAPGRDDWFTPWGGPPAVRSLAIDETGRLFVNVHVGGILRSDDEGGIWQPTGIEIEADVHQVATVAGHPDRLLAATGSGLAKSDDAGASWTIDADGLHGSYCRAVAVVGDRILVSASDGPHAERAAIYRGSWGATGFERCSDGLPEWFPDNIDTGCLAMQGETAAFGTQDGRVFASDDGGGRWRSMADSLPHVNCILLDRPDPDSA